MTDNGRARRVSKLERFSITSGWDETAMWCQCPGVSIRFTDMPWNDQPPPSPNPCEECGKPARVHRIDLGEIWQDRHW